MGHADQEGASIHWNPDLGHIDWGLFRLYYSLYAMVSEIITCRKLFYLKVKTVGFASGFFLGCCAGDVLCSVVSVQKKRRIP